MNAPLLMLLAWGIEVIFGWPDWLYKHMRHPVVWIGALISVFEIALNRTRLSHKVRYLAGAFTTCITLALVTCVAWMISALLPLNWLGTVLEALIASSLIATRSLYTHVAAVARPLIDGNVAVARHAVSMIVGRDPAALDEAGIARASLESLGESASDGVIAPLFWGAIFGLPGLAAYKTINTLDSVIGYKNDKYAAFGGFAARLDDLANLVPARLTGLMIAIASFTKASFKVMLRDARNHRSPNAGWPEAAMAGALGVRLSGPRAYGNNIAQEDWLNREARDPAMDDVQNGLALYIRAMALGAGLLGLAAWGTAR
ncbi:MAG: adenosylcobinamide-phosphate synthase CbiB [Pseudomonadota bacterium]